MLYNDTTCLKFLFHMYFIFANLCDFLLVGLVCKSNYHYLCLLQFQIKIWFQNRRTKWKRKYTSELELAAQQYYSAMGLVSPRPMVLGDRLWLFPNGPFVPPTPLNLPFSSGNPTAAPNGGGNVPSGMINNPSHGHHSLPPHHHHHSLPPSL